MNQPTNVQFRTENLPSCVFATQGRSVFDIEDFGSFSEISYRKHQESFHMPQEIDYNNHHVQYFESEQYSPVCVNDANTFNYSNASMYNDDQSCSSDYDMVNQYDNPGINPHGIQPPVTPNSLLTQLPCKINQKWDYNQCFSYYANGCYNTCQFVDSVDIEDFMNNEKRKEKSRDAARCRRSRETEIFTDMSQALPLTQQQVTQLDKASVMRLAISYLRVREMVNIVSDVPKHKEEIKTDDSVFLKSLEGFLLVLSAEGDFVYLSENVTDYLGITQIDLMGQNIYEYSHPCDHDEIKEILSTKTQESGYERKSFFIRLKCTLTSKGRSVNLKSATYKVIHVRGHIMHRNDTKDETNGNMQRCLVAIGQPIPHPSNIEAPLPHQTFLTKHSLDMKFTYADEKMMDFLGFTSEDLIGKSVYEYHHAMDSEAICSAYKCLFSKGQCETNRYRFLVKTGGYIWVLSQATLIYDKLQKPQSVVCVNYVISEIECKDEIYSACQLQSSIVKVESLSPAVVDTNNNNNTNCNSGVNSPKEEPSPKKTQPIIPETKPLSVTAKLIGNLVDPPAQSPRLQTATSKLFAPRTEEMSKGFLTFSEEEPGLTMLKDEPEDLTHLAPEAGGVCVPLDPFLPDLDDFLLRDDFSPLLTDEPSDPFMAYRDSCDPSPQLLSPNISKNSDCSLPSLNSPTDSLADEDQMSTFMSLHMDDDPELAMKAPYIPMNIGADFPLLMTEDLMWSSSDRTNNKNSSDSSSSLAQLLCSNINKRYSNSNANDHGGGLLTVDKNYKDVYDKNSTPSWSGTTPKKGVKEKVDNNHHNNKRTSSTLYDNSSKRTKSEPKEKMSSELLHQLISNNHNRGRPKDKSNWLLDSGGQKATCISQPSDSVLMNLLDDKMEGVNPKILAEKLRELYAQALMETKEVDQNLKSTIRKNSFSLLDPKNGIPSLLDLTQQDYEVNAPVNSSLLQGVDLLSALEQTEPI